MRNIPTNSFLAAIKNTISMSGPIVAARVSGGLNGFIVMLLVAQLGHSELAAGALINSIYFTFIVPIWQLFFAVGVLVGQKYGAKDYTEVGAITRQSLILGALAGIPIILISLHIDTILIFMGQDKHLADLTQQYFYGYVWSAIPSMWFVALGQTINGVSKQKASMIFTWIAIPFIIGIGYILMFGKFGLPKLGMKGMGYANACAFVIVDTIILLYFRFSKDLQKYKFFSKDKKIFTHYSIEIFQIGWPITLMVAAELGIFSLATIFVGWLGESQLAAWQITLQINMVAFMFPMGIGQATTILISQEIGRKNYSTIRHLSYAGLLLGLICTLISCLIYFVAPKFLISFFLNLKNPTTNNTLYTAITLLYITAIMNIFDTIRSVGACALRGLKDTIIPMLIFVVLGCILSLPLGYILSFPLHLGAIGMRWSFVFAFCVGAVILLFRLHKLTHPELVAQKHK